MGPDERAHDVAVRRDERVRSSSRCSLLDALALGACGLASCARRCCARHGQRCWLGPEILLSVCSAAKYSAPGRPRALASSVHLVALQSHLR